MQEKYPTEEINKFFSFCLSFDRIVVLSPHLDDAVLSMGILLEHLAQEGKKITVYNVFTQGSQLQTPLVHKLLRQSGFSEACSYFKERKKEDKEAIGKLGSITIKNLDYIDAAWRSDISGVPLYTETTLNIKNPLEEDTMKAVLKTFQTRFDTRENLLVFLPLGRGRHIDHLILRDTVRSLAGKKIYYSDFPYSLRFGEEQTFIKENNLKQFIWKNEKNAQKKKAVRRYKTQRFSLSEYGISAFPDEVFYTGF